MPMNDQIDAIVAQVAQQAADRVTRKTIADLRRMTNGLLSGDDSGLKTTWDEICVQVQGEESLYWEVYVETVCAILGVYVAELPTNERNALWLQTQAGFDWKWEDEWKCRDGEDREDIAVSDDDVVRYLFDEHVYPKAENWTNARIRAYIDRSSEWDEP